MSEQKVTFPKASDMWMPTRAGADWNVVRKDIANLITAQKKANEKRENRVNQVVYPWPAMVHPSDKEHRFAMEAIAEELRTAGYFVLPKMGHCDAGELGLQIITVGWAISWDHAKPEAAPASAV